MVSGLGERAVWYDAPNTYELEVYAKHQAVTLQIITLQNGSSSSFNNQAGAEAVAKDISEHL